jgi:flagellar basal-body rod protein FlgF
MDPLIAVAASGMRSRMESLDILANNMANASSAGFKADREFYNLYLSAEAGSGPEGNDPATQPAIDKHWTDFTQGSLSATDSPLNVAIAGPGFFVAQSPAGNLYTRDGNFRLSAKGELSTQDGYPVLSDDGSPIVLNSAQPIEISKDGTVRQEGIDVAKIGLVDFADVHVLNKQGNNYFQLSVSDLKPIPASKAELEQGKLESANFQPAESAARLITVLRQFESLQKAMGVGMDMNKKSIEDVARVS